MLRRRKSRAGMKMNFAAGGGSPTENGDFEDNVFEVEEGGGRTGEIPCGGQGKNQTFSIPIFYFAPSTIDSLLSPNIKQCLK